MKKTYIIPTVENVDYMAEEGIMLVTSTTPAQKDAEVLTKEEAWDIWEEE